MTLDNLLRIGKLKAHTATRIEVVRLLDAAEQSLADASVVGLSAASRLDLAWRAIMQGALAAMLCSGYRPTTSEPGHHQLLVQALPLTAGIARSRVRVLDSYRALRNQVDYRGVQISDAVADECRAEAHDLLNRVRSWIAARHPQLL
jgi:hypothetical protein